MNWEEKYLQQLYKSCPVQQEYHLLAVLDTSKGVHIRNLRAALTCRTLAEDIYADGRRFICGILGTPQKNLFWQKEN